MRSNEVYVWYGKMGVWHYHGCGSQKLLGPWASAVRLSESSHRVRLVDADTSKDL